MNQTSMKQPPNVISNKDLSYIEDMLAWNLTAAKSAREFASHVNDQEIKQELEQTFQMHKKHYDELLNFLQSHANMN
ncbi:MAG: spore coat protein [Bacilli bacterium]|nr:spore coat protein [Bacilli bacterium]